MGKMIGVVKTVFTSRTQKEGKTGEPTDELKKSITIKGDEDCEGVSLTIQGDPDMVDEIFEGHLDEDVTVEFKNPQTRLPVEESTPKRKPIEEIEE